MSMTLICVAALWLAVPQSDYEACMGSVRNHCLEVCGEAAPLTKDGHPDCGKVKPVYDACVEKNEKICRKVYPPMS